MRKSRTTTDLAGQIRREIAKAGLNAFQLSNRAGVYYASVHGFLHGDKDPKLSTISKLCGVLDLELRPIRRKRV